MERKANTKSAQSEQTISRLRSVARELFSEKPYGTVSTEEIVRRAEVTRGALYHHFGGKDELFIAVFEEVQREIATKIEVAASTGDGLWADFLSGCRAFMETCIDPKTQRIVFIEAPSVLGWERWRKVDENNGLIALKDGLTELMDVGLLPRQPVDVLAHLLSGAMNEAALWITQAKDPEIALKEAIQTLEKIINGLRS